MLYTTHYSAMIEGNRLDADQIKDVLQHKEHFPGRERDEQEVKGYYAALTQVEQWVAQNVKITENIIQTLHALIMSNGKTNVKPTKYRDGQNVIKDSGTKAIIYMPPEAQDVKSLMQAMISWINDNTKLQNTPKYISEKLKQNKIKNEQMPDMQILSVAHSMTNIAPFPIIAGIAHYQFATIHPYYDGNGRTARLVTTLMLHLGGYDLKGLYSLEEYYAKNLGGYYEAISIGHHNYYMGRAEADITKWIEYFIEGMAISFEKVLNQMQEANNKGFPDTSLLLKSLILNKERL